MRGLKVIFGITAVLVGLALAPAAQAQVVVSFGVQPVCAYGYYNYQPYACAPYGFYGPGYFYNGIFLGMGPWAGWGYGHGWGGHRFSDGGGRSYRGGGGVAANRTSYARGGTTVRTSNGGGHNAGGARPSAGHAAPSHAAPSHTTAAHSSGGSHASGGQVHPGGGGGQSHDGGNRH